MRELIEKGFEVNVVSDATAGGNVPDLGDGYEAALINFRFIASSVLDTDATISSMGMADPTSIVFPSEPMAVVRPPSPGRYVRFVDFWLLRGESVQRNVCERTER